MTVSPSLCDRLGWAQAQYKNYLTTMSYLGSFYTVAKAYSIDKSEQLQQGFL